MSASDNSDPEKIRFDLDKLIEKALYGGPRAPDELLKTVMKKTQVNERTYYRHLQKLLKSHRIEEVSEDVDGRINRKYALKASEVSAPMISPLLKPAPAYECVSPSRRYLEIAAWLRREPEDWPPFEAVRKAKLLEKNYASLIPAIEASCEDPDLYAFIWSDEACYGQRYGEFVQSRFFRLKDVYQAVEDSKPDSAASCGGMFVAAYGSEVAAEQVMKYGDMETQIRTLHRPMELQVIKEPFSVCVAVCKEANSLLRVTHVEGRSGKLDKTWVKGVSTQLGAKAESMLSWEASGEDVKRAALLKLRHVLEKHTLRVPNRYVKLVEELLDYSYKNLSTGYVYALALAVDLASP